MKYISIGFIPLLALMAATSQAAVTWDGGGGDGLWTTPANWDANNVPIGTDDVVVGLSAAVTGATNVFSKLDIQSGASVTMASDFLAAGNTIKVDGTLNRAGVLRLIGSKVELTATGKLGAGVTFLDTSGGTMNFTNGASFGNAAMDFEHKGTNTFGYTLSLTGFQKLIANRLRSGNSAVWADATYNIDISQYNTANGSTVVLADYASHDPAYSGTFNPTVNIIAGSSGLAATLSFDTTTSRLLLTFSYDSNTIVWDGGGGDSAWTTAGNWHTNSVPLAANQVIVGAGAVVSNGQDVFSSLTIEAGATVAFAGDTLSGSKTLNVAGTLDRAGVLRFYSTMQLSGRLGPNITFLDTNGSTINFVNGANFSNVNMDFEHKGINTFGYTLSPTGFQKLNAGQLRSGNSAVWADVTYNIDISHYNTANGSTIVLADYASHDAAYSGTFNPTVNIIAGASELQGTLGFNASLSQLVLTITPVVHDTPIALNQSVSTPVNTAANFVLTGTDPEGDSLTFAVVTGPSHGTLSGTVPNLTYTPDNNFIGTDTLTFTASDGTFLSNPGTVTFAATPQTATQLWASLDTAIRTNALNTEWQTTWVDGGVTLHQIRFDLGTLTGTQRTASPKIAAYYAYPTGGTNLPGIVEAHGGGQRASVAEAKYWAEQGYACISINWGGLPLNAGLANTDWDGLPAGFVRTGVTQAIHREEPEGRIYNDGSTLFADAHPLNISYLLNSYAARRALTFLSGQGNVASGKLGVTGHSMGGQITVLTATDPRITCVTPSVGGSGYLFRDWWGLPGTARAMNSVHLDWYERTADPRSYWPSITCPTLFLQSSNDFNAPFDLVTKAMALQNPAVPQRLAVAPHFNHRFDDASYASRVLWQKAHLTGGFDFPKTSVAELDLNQNNGIPLFSVWPDASTAHSIVSVDIYYGYDRDSLTRFWRDAKAVETSPGLWQARCPVHDTDEPLVAYAIVTYDCGFNLAMPAGYTSPTRHFSVVSEVKTVYPPDLANHGVRATETELRKIDDFSRGFHDWFILNPGHPTLFEFWTRKPNDPTWNGANGSRLSLGVTTTAAGNSLGITLQTVQWNSSASTEYHATVALNAAGVHAVSLQVSDFTNGLNEALTTWDNVKLLRLSAGRLVDGTKAAWAGAIPVFSNLRWEGGSYPEDFTTSKGTPNLWLYENGLVVEGDYAAADLIDSDSDGGKNWEEYLAGTDPNNPASAFKITSFSSAGNQHTIEWQAVAGKTYSVWFSDDLMGSNWILKGAGIPGVEPTTSATVPANGNRGFFRVGVAP
ncbi:MAG: Ig-like domain-containing protein [Verrucomicrobia bacterium]|nr:Ig-like domain-containing protein [Verrucomicrobiota bacterium]